MTGTINYAVASGLGNQTKAFVDHGLIDKILIQPHSTYPVEHHYKPEQVANSIEELLKCDRLIFMETVFNWRIIAEARRRGIKTILITHYECTPDPLPWYPDVLVAPSSTDLEYFPSAVRINIPVEYPWKLRKRARVFVHNAGHGGLGGRNGTKELLEAMQYVKSPIKLLVRTQNGSLRSDDPRVEIIHGSVPYESLWSVGDVCILPEKFGGSFLPMQEAFASGMPVMASNRDNNHWLPKELLIPVSSYKEDRISTKFQSAIIDPKEIARMLDFWYDKDITEYSKMGKKWAEDNSWEKLKPLYDSL
jgi:glycosyltransferase involved in cell wall biosynthesis